MPLQDEIRYRILKMLEADPALTQRELAQALGMSLGKTNFCLRALVDKGLIKVDNFRNKQNKLAYAYLLTPAGIIDKVNVTRSFLQRKLVEYDALETEIARLRSEAQLEPSLLLVPGETHSHPGPPLKGRARTYATANTPGITGNYKTTDSNKYPYET